MGYKIIFSPQSIQDIQEVVSFIAKDNPSAAERFGLRLCDKVQQLENFPRLGRVVPEFRLENIRELIFKSYRTVYGVNDHDQTIEVFHFWHGARGTPELPFQL